MKGVPQDIGAKKDMTDFSRIILRLAAEKNCDVRLATNMEYVELQPGELAIADDGFVIVIGEN